MPRGPEGEKRPAEVIGNAALSKPVTFNPRPIRLGLAWGLVATHALSGQQEHIVGFHTETEAKEWLASKGYRAWLRTRGYVKPITTFAMPGKSPTRR
jgi:hypothetical protein